MDETKNMQIPEGKDKATYNKVPMAGSYTEPASGESHYLFTHPGGIEATLFPVPFSLSF